jgi:beta-mannosidase
MKGWGHPEAYKNGDVHYWGVWWGKEPFSAYDNHVGRFVSEYGFQGMPPLSSFRLFDSNGNFSLTDPIVLAHQKNENGFATINEYMQNNYPVPTDFSDYVYVSQVMQRDAISKAVEAHRRAMPYCMGTLFWQLDDCWPGTSWSATDYYGQPKLLSYAMKDLYAPLMVSVTEKNDSVFIYVINDGATSHKGILGFQWMTFEGLNVRTSIAQTNVNGESSNLILSFSKKTLLDTLAPERGVIM